MRRKIKIEIEGYIKLTEDNLEIIIPPFEEKKYKITLTQNSNFVGKGS